MLIYVKNLRKDCKKCIVNIILFKNTKCIALHNKIIII